MTYYNLKNDLVDQLWALKGLNHLWTFLFTQILHSIVFDIFPSF
jgi:hypothetical protein